MAAAVAMPYLELVVGFIVVVNILRTYLDIRQLRAIKLPTPPAALAELFTNDVYIASQKYAVDKWWFGCVHGVYSLIETIAALWFGVLPWVWKSTGEVFPALSQAGQIPHTIVFVLVLMFVNVIMELPWSLYSTFVLEQRHGFNKQTLGVFISDFVKSLVVGALLMPPVIAGFTYILQHAGPWVPIYLWAFVLAVALFMMTIYPVVIAPLFNKFENLPDGSLRQKIEQLAGSLKFPLKKLYSMDGSKRSAHSNAYMYGFFNNKRIVLFDTLIKQCSEEQVVAVLAHELGHWKLRHTPINFIMGQAIMLVQFGLFTLIRNSDSLYESFGFTEAKPAFIAFVLFQFILSPVDEVSAKLPWTA